MAVDKLVDSTKLDACLDAEADAIRAKTGGSADILFDFANNKGFADAIAAISSGGGGLEYETGTVTIANENGRLVINHGLNSTKIIGFVVPIAGETYASVNTSVYQAGYKTYTAIFGNLNDAVGGAFTLDLSSYREEDPQTIDYATTTNIPVEGAQLSTPWLTSSHPSIDTQQNVSSVYFKSSISFTANGVTDSGGARGWMKGTFRYLLIKFG